MARFSWLGGRREETAAEAAPAPQAAENEPVVFTKALAKFVAALTPHAHPVVVDVGPVVGANIAFFGEQLGCKIHIEDLYADLDRHARENTLEGLAVSLTRRLAHPDASVDGVLCWDFLDYLDRRSAQAVATQLVRLLRPGGVLLGFFHATPESMPFFVRHAVVDAQRLSCRVYPSHVVRRGGLQNREIIRLFEGLRVSDSFLLKTHVRELLFRKALQAPAATPAGRV